MNLPDDDASVWTKGKGLCDARQIKGVITVQVMPYQRMLINALVNATPTRPISPARS